jgi:glycerol-3-phosphate dehydrogenase
LDRRRARRNPSRVPQAEWTWPPLLQAARERGRWDLIVIGGGATGLGCALDAVSRGLSTLLLEARDFASGTSSRSTKLIHGGVRYLAQGRLHLVREALVERSRLLANAPHAVRPLSFVVPCKSMADRLYFAAGLKAYDVLAGAQGIGQTRWLGRKEMRRALPNVGAQFSGGISYEDAQFDDAALALSILRTFQSMGGIALNYCPVKAFEREGGRVVGVLAEDLETGAPVHLPAGSVINAAGVWGEAVRRLDDPFSARLMRPSQGIHVVVDRRFVGGYNALMIPKTSDGRVLFAIPWQGRALLGTTDTTVDAVSEEPRALESEIDYVLDTARQYLAEAPQRKDVRSVFAGLRPLVDAAAGESTAQLSREHAIRVSPSGLLSISGGKWTTYRRMAEDALDHLLERHSNRWRPTQTAGLALLPRDPLPAKGREVEPFSKAFPDLTPALVRRAVQTEMARNVEDVLARRYRALFLDAEAASRVAPAVARIIAEELGLDVAQVAAQTGRFAALARQYAGKPEDRDEASSGGPGGPASRAFFS